MMWVCRTGQKALDIEMFFTNNKIYLPWEGYDSDYSNCTDLEKFREIVIKEKNIDNRTTISNWSSQLYQFVNGISIGDYVLVPGPQSRFYHLAKITGNYIYSSKDKYHHSRNVEFLIEDEKEVAARERLVRMTCKGFALETASESPAPGGGSISAYMGALGAALGTMVANLSSHKAGWDDRWKEFSDWADKGQDVMRRLLALVDEDTAAFDKIMAAIGMPKGSEEEKAARAAALEAATLYATEVPLKTMKAALEVFPIVKAMAAEGNPNSVSDAGVGALAARSAVLGAQLNVRINAAGLADREAADRLCAEAAEIAAQAVALEAEVLEITNSKI